MWNNIKNWFIRDNEQNNVSYDYVHDLALRVAVATTTTQCINYSSHILKSEFITSKDVTINSNLDIASVLTFCGIIYSILVENQTIICEYKDTQTRDRIIPLLQASITEFDAYFSALEEMEEDVPTDEIFVTELRSLVTNNITRTKERLDEILNIFRF